MKLQKSMEITEKKQKDQIIDFNKSADEAKVTLNAIEKNLKARKDIQVRTLESVKEKVQHNNFELQRINYDKKKELEEVHQNHFSELAIKKFEEQKKKSRKIRDETNTSI